MKKALIGYTGFVGSNIKRQIKFDHYYNSSNIDEINDYEYDLVVCAAPSAVKWKANQFPKEDLKIIDSLIESLKKINTKKFIQISTIDIYKTPDNVDETSIIEQAGLHPYGKHRFHLEQFIESNFSDHTIVRLPGLFGEGLKKNFIFDLINNNALDYTHKDSKFQFFYLKHLWNIIDISIKNDVGLINITSEPISAQELAKKCFGIDFTNITPDRLPVSYNVKTVYGGLFKGKNGYIYSKMDIMDEIKNFINKK